MAENVDCNAGRATLTTVPSMNDMLDPRIVAARTRSPLEGVGPIRDGAPDGAFVTRGSADVGHPRLASNCCLNSLTIPNSTMPKRNFHHSLQCAIDRRPLGLAPDLRCVETQAGRPSQRRSADRRDNSHASGVQPQLLYRALRTLASHGVFAEIKGRRFKLTPLGATLRTDVQPSMNGFALMLVEKHVSARGNSFSTPATDGRPAGFDRIFGKPFYNYLEDLLQTTSRFSARR